MDRAALNVDTLLKIVLVLIVALLALEVADRFIDTVFGAFRPVISLLLLLLVILWLLDQI